MTHSGTVFVVDDDQAVRELIEATLGNAGLNVRSFPSADALNELMKDPAPSPAAPRPPCCLLLDLVLPGTSGLDFLEQKLRAGFPCPTIVITARGSIRAAVKSMKLGAIDFIEKPFSPEDLKAVVLDALVRFQKRSSQAEELQELRARVARLSRRERELLIAIVQGQSTKMIAENLGISVRTVDHHRANLMDKMRATNVADLVRMAMQAGSADESGTPALTSN